METKTLQATLMISAKCRRSPVFTDESEERFRRSAHGSLTSRSLAWECAVALASAAPSEVQGEDYAFQCVDDVEAMAQSWMDNLSVDSLHIQDRNRDGDPVEFSLLISLPVQNHALTNEDFANALNAGMDWSLSEIFEEKIGFYGGAYVEDVTISIHSDADDIHPSP